MILKDALKSGKLIRRSCIGPGYGSVLELNDKYRLVYLNGDTTPVVLADLIADDWEIKPEPREFWVGMTKIQSHTKEVQILQAFISTNKPTSRTANGEEWFRVVEVLEPAITYSNGEGSPVPKEEG